MIKLKVKKNSVYASTPMYANNDDRNAGADVFAAESKIVWPKGKVIINTRLNIEPILKPVFPDRTPNWFVKFIDANFKCAVFVKARSGLSLHYSIEHGAGVIDEGYRGEVRIILYNHGWLPYRIKKGDRVAQFVPHLLPVTEIIKSKHLSETVRGEKGFGSSGKT